MNNASSILKKDLLPWRWLGCPRCGYRFIWPQGARRSGWQFFLPRLGLSLLFDKRRGQNRQKKYWALDELRVYSIVQKKATNFFWAKNAYKFWTRNFNSTLSARILAPENKFFDISCNFYGRAAQMAAARRFVNFHRDLLFEKKAQTLQNLRRKIFFFQHTVTCAGRGINWFNSWESISVATPCKNYTELIIGCHMLHCAYRATFALNYCRKLLLFSTSRPPLAGKDDLDSELQKTIFQ